MITTFVTVLALAADPAPGTFNAPATAVSVSGRVEMRLGDQLRPIERFGQVPATATIITYEDSSASLRLASGSLIRLGPKTEVQLRRLEQGTPAGHRKETVSVKAGRVWASVLRLLGQESSFEVEAGNAVAGVRGTALFASVTGGDASYVVEHGRVDVQMGGTSVTLDGPGSSVNVGGGGFSPPLRLAGSALRELRQSVGGARASLGGGTPTPSMLSAAPPPESRDQVRDKLVDPASAGDVATNTPAAAAVPSMTNLIIEILPPTYQPPY